jgi:hypothetical protein
MEEGEGRDFNDGSSEIVQKALLLVSCIWCAKLHRAELPLEFNPVCSTCTARCSIMRLLEMNGSYPLSNEAIDAALTRTSPGNYALGYMDDAMFVVYYVGRSDSDVRQRLQDWVGAPGSVRPSARLRLDPVRTVSDLSAAKIEEQRAKRNGESQP